MNKDTLKDILQSGGEVRYRDLYILPLPIKYKEKYNRGGWQVHAEHVKLQNLEFSNKINKKEKGFFYSNAYSKIFFELDEAIEKFLGLKLSIYRNDK